MNKLGITYDILECVQKYMPSGVDVEAIIHDTKTPQTTCYRYLEKMENDELIFSVPLKKKGSNVYTSFFYVTNNGKEAARILKDIKEMIPSAFK